MTTDNYIFREKIRHPSGDKWIITRDYGPTNTIANTYTITGTVSPTSFIVKSKSYNYKQQETSNIWINNTQTVINDESYNVINKNSINWNALNMDSEVHRMNPTLTFDETTEDSSVSIVVNDIVRSVTTSGYYGENGTNITIIPSESDDWTDRFLTKEINTAVSNDIIDINDYIKSGDYLLVPNVKSDNSFTLDTYQIDSTVTETTTVSLSYNFSYDNINNDVDKSVLNIMKNNNNINIDNDIFNTWSENIINNLTFNEDGQLIAINDTSFDTSVSIKLYGNGILLNRFNKLDTIIDKSYDYTWFMVRDSQNTKYVLHLIYDNQNNYWKIDTLIKVGITIKNNNILLRTLETLSSYSGTLTMKWLDFIGDTNIDFNRYKQFNAYHWTNNTDSIAINNKVYNDQDNQKNIISIDNPQTIISDPDDIEFDNLNIDNIHIYTNNLNICDIGFSSISTTTTTATISIQIADNQSITGEVTLTTNNDNTEVSIGITNNNNNNFIQRFLDYVINQNNIQYNDINIYLAWSAISGQLIYTGTASDVYAITRLNNNDYNTSNLISIYGYSDIWSRMRLRSRNNVANELTLSYSWNSTNNIPPIQLHYPYWNNNLINYEDVDFTGGKVWFIVNTNQIINNESTYFISKNDLKTDKRFLNLIKELYTDINATITLNNATITYQLAEYINGMRLCDSESGELINLGNEYTPVYIKNGCFVVGRDIRDVLIEANNSIGSSNSGQNIWIDPDD